MNYRIAIIDDHRFVRDGLRDCVRAWTKGQVVLEAENGLDYEQRLPETGHVHLALVDLRMPKRDGCETMRWMARHQKRTLALAFSFEITTANVVRALRAGARLHGQGAIAPRLARRLR
ncbi:MAG: response regulator transcription factor [Flavobacteriales bacterium]|nr:response regulator transcription factor [Flavobacteriales bacterium]